MAEDAEDDIEAGEGGEGAEGGEPKKGGMKKLILFVGLPVVILLLGGVAGGLLLFGGGEEEAVAEGEAAGQELSPADALVEGLDRFHASAPFEFEIDIEGDDGRPLMMELHFTVIYENEDVGRVLGHEAMKDRLQSTYLEFLRTLRPDDIYGSMGTFRLRAELLRRTNLEIQPLSAEEVLIDELLII